MSEQPIQLTLRERVEILEAQMKKLLEGDVAKAQHKRLEQLVARALDKKARNDDAAAE